MLVSELMLQQTTVAAVVPLYLRWMDKFPTAEALAVASQESVMQAWSGLGYYSRAKRLHQTAQILCRSDSPPATLEGLLNLPGLGPYTAAAVASIALGLPHLALDTNVFRVLLRLYGWPTRIDLPGVADTLRQRVEKSLPNSDFGITNQALMELGATVCKVRSPACLICPLAEDCRARALAIADQIPVAKPRKAVKATPTTAYVLERADSGLLMIRGTSLGLLNDMFAPPLDFHTENPTDSPMTRFLQWLRSRTGETRATTTYGISGRRLTIEVRKISSHEVAEEALVRARNKGGLEARFWLPGQELALSSLTRKILAVWQETHADLQDQGEKY